MTTDRRGDSNNDQRGNGERRPIPEWQKDPYGWIDYSDKGNNGRCSSDVDADENNNTARIFCVLQNIQNRPELNGWIGVVVGYDPGVRRYRVQLCRESNNSNSNSHSNSNNNSNSNSNSNNRVLSLAPEKVRRAHLVEQWKGKLQLLRSWLLLQPIQNNSNNNASIYQQIRRDGREWLRRIVPPGIIAGNAGPTDEQLDALWTGSMVAAAFGLVVPIGALAYAYGFTKACTASSFVATVVVVAGGPEYLFHKSSSSQRRQQQEQQQYQSSSSWKQQCGRRLKHLAQDMCGQQLSATGVMAVTVAWCMFTAWILFLT